MRGELPVNEKEEHDCQAKPDPAMGSEQIREPARGYLDPYFCDERVNGIDHHREESNLHVEW